VDKQRLSTHNISFVQYRNRFSNSTNWDLQYIF